MCWENYQGILPEIWAFKNNSAKDRSSINIDRSMRVSIWHVWHCNGENVLWIFIGINWWQPGYYVLNRCTKWQKTCDDGSKLHINMVLFEYFILICVSLPRESFVWKKCYFFKYYEDGIKLKVQVTQPPKSTISLHDSCPIQMFRQTAGL